MSTIDPGQLDNFVANPPDGSGDPDNPVNYEPAAERTFRTPVQQQFEAAKVDIEAVENLIGDHIGTGGIAEHPVATSSAAGFAPALPNDGLQYLDGNGGWTIPTGVGFRIAELNGTAFSGARTRLNMVPGTGMQIGAVDDSSGDRSTYTISFASPLTAKGDIYTRNASADVNLSVGSDGQVLSANSATSSGLEWVDQSGGDVTNPPNAKGQLWGHDGSTTQRVPAAGSNNLILASDTSESTGMKWETTQAFSPTQSKGDLITRDSGSSDIRLPVGADGLVLEADASEPSGLKWGTKSSSGGGDVTGPNGGVVDNEITLFSGTTGKTIKGSGILSTAIAQTKQENGTGLLVTNIISVTAQELASIDAGPGRQATTLYLVR